MKNAPTGKTNKSAERALTEQAHYTLLQITIKAAPWLTLHAVAIVVVSLNAGRLAL